MVSAPQSQPRICVSMGIAYYGKLLLNPTQHGIELHGLAGGLSRAAFSRPLLRLLKQYGRTRPKVDRSASGVRFDPPKITDNHYMLAILPAAEYVVQPRPPSARASRWSGRWGCELFRIGGPRW